MATHVPLPSVGEGGVELRNSNRTNASPTEDLRPPRLEEGRGAPAVVRALRRLAYRGAQARAAFLRVAREVRLDGQLRAAQRQRRVVGEQREIVVGRLLQLGRRHQPLDEADRERL